MSISVLNFCKAFTVTIAKAPSVEKFVLFLTSLKYAFYTLDLHCWCRSFVICFTFCLMMNKMLTSMGKLLLPIIDWAHSRKVDFAILSCPYAIAIGILFLTLPAQIGFLLLHNPATSQRIRNSSWKILLVQEELFQCLCYYQDLLLPNK